MNRTIYALCLLLMLVAIPGCGAGDDTTAVTAVGPEGKPAAGRSEEEAAAKIGPTKVFRADTAEHEMILFDEQGYALYRFDKDKGSKSTCYGACAKRWPPLLTEGEPIAYAVIPDELGTTKRKDGTTQVTYFGHPLYNYVGDKSVETGKVTGHGVKAFGGEWYSIHKNGKDLKH